MDEGDDLFRETTYASPIRWRLSEEAALHLAFTRAIEGTRRVPNAALDLQQAVAPTLAALAAIKLAGLKLVRSDAVWQQPELPISEPQVPDCTK